MIKSCVSAVFVCGVMLVLGGCSAGSPPKIEFGENPNSYQPRLGVYPFQAQVEAGAATSAEARGEVAADYAAEMFDSSGRFKVIVRKPFLNMLRQQKKTEMFRNGVLATPGPIEGVEYVLTGSISNLSIKKEAKPLGFTQKISAMFSKAASKKTVDVNVTCNVGMRIVDLSTGDEVVANNSQFERAGPAQSLGLDMMASSTKFGAMPVTEEDREQVIKLALFDAVNKALPKIDRYIKSLGDMQSPPTPPPTPGTPTTGAGATNTIPAKPVAKICPACKTPNDPKATICKACGANL
jgi:curli biogenesis system outer membrane secretion channel CsgG